MIDCSVSSDEVLTVRGWKLLLTRLVIINRSSTVTSLIKRDCFKQLFGLSFRNAGGQTDTKGRFHTRGFHGDYDITVSHPGKTERVNATVDREGATISVQLL